MKFVSFVCVYSFVCDLWKLVVKENKPVQIRSIAREKFESAIRKRVWSLWISLTWCSYTSSDPNVLLSINSTIMLQSNHLFIELIKTPQVLSASVTFLGKCESARQQQISIVSSGHQEENADHCLLFRLGLVVRTFLRSFLCGRRPWQCLGSFISQDSFIVARRLSTSFELYPIVEAD